MKTAPHLRWHLADRRADIHRQKRHQRRKRGSTASMPALQGRLQGRARRCLHMPALQGRLQGRARRCLHSSFQLQQVQRASRPQSWDESRTNFVRACSRKDSNLSAGFLFRISWSLLRDVLRPFVSWTVHACMKQERRMVMGVGDWGLGIRDRVRGYLGVGGVECCARGSAIV